MRVEIKQRIEQLLSDILSDRYQEEYGVKVTLHFVPASEAQKEGK